jgi:uncharacterized protein
MTRALCIAIHDVAPATRAACDALFDLLQSVGAPPATLLVVPDYHRRGSIERDIDFVRAIDARIGRGDEVALHGWHHLDDGPASYDAFEWLRRRVLTASEGEFAALTEHEAALRLDAGLRMFERLRWTARGFVAPAWLLGAGARAALARTSIRWTSTHTQLQLIADGRRIAAPAISASARSAWRRWTSKRWLRIAASATRRAPIVRVALHPSDAIDTDVMHAWRALLVTLLDEREPLTKSDALARASARDATHAWADA